MRKKSLLFLVLVLLNVSGCVALMPKGGKHDKYLANFNKEVLQVVTLDRNSQMASVNLLSIPGVVQILIPFDEGEKIVAIKLRDDGKLNINRYLTTNGEYCDYIVNENNNIVMINMNMPLIYYIDGFCRLEVSIVKYKGIKKNAKMIMDRKSLVFNWAPFRRPEDGETGFSYFTNLSTVEGGERTKYRQQLLLDMKKTKFSRLSPGYQAMVNDFLNKN